MIPEYLNDIIEQYAETVVQQTDRQFIETALELAYWTAMLDAAKNDPLDDDPFVQRALIERFEKEIQRLTEKFQTLGNDLL